MHEQCTLLACAPGSRADLVAPVRLELHATDVSRRAGHAGYRIILDRARQASQ